LTIKELNRFHWFLQLTQWHTGNKLQCRTQKNGLVDFFMISLSLLFVFLIFLQRTPWLLRRNRNRFCGAVEIPDFDCTTERIPLWDSFGFPA
jgi:hypothetical protein